jgi:hypothetical protein
MNLMHGDCLELMAQIPDGSVDMMLVRLTLWHHGLQVGFGYPV